MTKPADLYVFTRIQMTITYMPTPQNTDDHGNLATHDCGSYISQQVSFTSEIKLKLPTHSLMM